MRDWTKLKAHKLNTFPSMKEDEYESLLDSMDENGYDDSFPIVVYKGLGDEEEAVIDGMNRLRACIELNEVPLIREFYGTIQDAVSFILRTNERRSLTAGQKAAVILDMNDVVDEIQGYKKEAQQSGLVQNQQSNDNEDFDRGVTSTPTEDTVRSADIIADMAGTSASTVKHMKAIKNNSQELYDAVKDGSLNAKAVYNQIRDVEAKAKAEQDNDDSYFLRKNAAKLVETSISSAAKYFKTEMYEGAYEALEKMKEDGTDFVDFDIQFVVTKKRR